MLTQTNASASTPTDTVVRFHLSLNVADLDRAIAFFRVFFDCQPAKCRPNYAKFELTHPPLVLSLEPRHAPPGGNLNHLGFRMSDSAALVEVQRRLELAGISTRREDGVACCYSRQTKFWVNDPDGNMWEVYTLDEDIEHCGDGRSPALTDDSTPDGRPALAIWKHELGQPFPEHLPIFDATVDRVMLEGTFNEALSPAEQRRRLAEIHRVLKPGGEVHVHLLTANQPLADVPWRLPGPAAGVTHVATNDEVLQQFEAAGFSEPRLVFHATLPCFHAAGAELREARIQARKH